MRVTWEWIYSEWKRRCHRLYKPILMGSYFKNIEINNLEIFSSPFQQNYKQIDLDIVSFVDWWSLSKDEETNLNIFKNNLNNRYRRTGHLKTAEMFWQHKNDPQKTALIWIGASLTNIIENNRWSNLSYSFVEELWDVVIDKMLEEGISIWNGNIKFPLPCEIFNYYSFIDAFQPKTIKAIIDLIALESTYVCSTQQLVHIRYRDVL